MKIGLMIYGDINTLSGGYLYDRKLVKYLEKQGDTVDIISLDRLSYIQNILHQFDPDSLPGPGLDILIQDELIHPSVYRANSRIKKHCRVPIVGLIHLLSYSAPRVFYKKLLHRIVEKKYIKSVNGLILNSNSTLQHLQNLVGPDVPAHVIAVPAGDNFSNINNNNPVTPGIRTNSDTLKVLYVGNVISQKGVDKIIKSMSGPEMVDIQLTITGRTDIEPGYARRINRLIKKYHMLDRVHLTGPMNTDLLKHAYQSHDVLVLPSVNEAYGIVYLEAMSFGLPVIGTTAGGAKEIIKHGENGLLIPPGDYFQLMQYLSRLHLDRDLLNRLGKNALMTYQLHPTWNDTCRIIREFLCQMVSQAKHSK